MPKHRTRGSQADRRLELLEALIEHRGEQLMEATVAACAIIAHADGVVVPAEVRRVISIARTDPLLCLFPPEAVLAQFEAHADAIAADFGKGRAEALRDVAPLATRPGLARVVLDACLAVTCADDRVHPGEMQAIALVRDTLGLAPEPGGSAHPSEPGRGAMQRAAGL